MRSCRYEQKRVKKPQAKKTLTLLQRMQRRRGIRELEKRFLIVCEDEIRPELFQLLHTCRKTLATKVVVCGSGGNTQPVQVVKCACERKAAAEKEDSGTEPFDQVWCVIDGDYGTEINNARSKARAQGVELAISTKCFEYWGSAPLRRQCSTHEELQRNCWMPEAPTFASVR